MKQPFAIQDKYHAIYKKNKNTNFSGNTFISTNPLLIKGNKKMER